MDQQKPVLAGKAQMVSVEQENEHRFVIVGGGIGGLSTALALHRKGFRDVAVYERSECLRVEGTAIGVSPNGWRALDQLGVADELREKAILLQGGEDIWFDKGKRQKMQFLTGEFRCLKRRDLVNALANALPLKTIRFGCNVVSVKTDPQSMSPVLQLDDRAVRAKVLIGCDGSQSKVADFLGLKPASLFSLGAVRGLTRYPNGHSFPPVFIRLRDKNDCLVGRVPMTEKLVYWFVSVRLTLLDGKFPNDPELIKQETLRMIAGFPAEALELVEKSDLDTLSFTRLKYRHPWEIMVRKFHKGSVTVLGDAMHAMGPFLGQGGSAAMEDAVVLARNLGHKLSTCADQPEGIEEALDQYVKERRTRVAQLCTQTYLIGSILGTTSSLVKFLAIIILVMVFRDPTGHTKYDCGQL